MLVSRPAFPWAAALEGEPGFSGVPIFGRWFLHPRYLQYVSSCSGLVQ